MMRAYVLTAMLAVLAAASSATLLQNNPVIAIMTLPQDQCTDPSQGYSCVPSEYIRWLESAGAQVVPLLYDSPAEKVRDLYGKVNGVLFTGGGLGLELDSQYVKTAKVVYDSVTSDKNDRVPMWGTCMGFQLMHILTAWNLGYDSKNISWPLQLSPNASSSRFFRGVQKETIRTLTEEASTFNWHHDGVPPSNYKTFPKLKEFFNVLALNDDRKGKTFISLVEAKEWPMYGIQFHAERNQFQFKPSYAIDHSEASVRAMHDVAMFFVREAKLNAHSFPSEDELQAALMANYPRINLGSSYGVEEYYFPASN